MCWWVEIKPLRGRLFVFCSGTHVLLAKPPVMPSLSGCCYSRGRLGSGLVSGCLCFSLAVLSAVDQTECPENCSSHLKACNKLVSSLAALKMEIEQLRGKALTVCALSWQQISLNLNECVLSACFAVLAWKRQWTLTPTLSDITELPMIDAERGLTQLIAEARHVCHLCAAFCLCKNSVFLNDKS